MRNVETKNKSTKNTQYTGFYVETLNRGKPQGNRSSTVDRYKKTYKSLHRQSYHHIGLRQQVHLTIPLSCLFLTLCTYNQLLTLKHIFFIVCPNILIFIGVYYYYVILIIAVNRPTDQLVCLTHKSIV